MSSTLPARRRLIRIVRPTRNHIVEPDPLDIEIAKTRLPNDFERLEFTEACSMTRFVIDIIIRLIAALLPLSLGLTTFGFTTNRWELFVTSAAVLVILGLIIWRTYRLVNGFLISVLIAEKRFSSLPDTGPFHLFVSIALSLGYQKRLREFISTLYPYRPVASVRGLPPAHLGTPRWLVYGGLFTLTVFNIFMACYQYQKSAIALSLAAPASVSPASSSALPGPPKPAASEQSVPPQ